MKGECLKCKRYGEVERHHPLPQRWFGRGDANTWTETLCRKCHLEADNITLKLDRREGITNYAVAQYYRQIFVTQFYEFMNDRTVVQGEEHDLCFVQ